MASLPFTLTLSVSEIVYYRVSGHKGFFSSPSESTFGGVLIREAQPNHHRHSYKALNIGYYLVGMAVIALVATLLLRNRNGINLRPTQEERQREGIYVWQKPVSQGGSRG